MTEHPILFKADMVQAIMTCAQCGTVTLEIECPKCGSKERRKTQTRRIIPGEIHVNPTNTSWHWHKPRGGYMERHDERGNDRVFRNILGDHSPYGGPGDLLWVRETWWDLGWTENGKWNGRCESHVVGVKYCATCEDPFDDEDDYGLRRHHWRTETKLIQTYRKRPSIYMPKWACRLWLKVKSIRVERVQEITWQGCKAEGITLIGDELVFNNPTQQHSLLRTKFTSLWDSINKASGHGWDKNDYVRVVEFERYDHEQNS